MSYYVQVGVDLCMTVEVEAGSQAEAERIVDTAWSEDENFVNRYLKEAEVFDFSISEGMPEDYGMPLNEMIE